MTPMVPVEVIRFDSPLRLADVAAQQFVDLAGSARLLALCGGRIARLFLQSVAGYAVQSGQRFPSTHFFWSDERCVPPSDSESNFALANSLLLRPLKIDTRRVHRIQGEANPGCAASVAEAELRNLAETPKGQSPILDLVLLGMGEDGHVASLFPAEDKKMVSDPVVYRAVAGPKPPLQRITLGYQVLAAAREVWVFASGPGKERALSLSLRGGDTPLGRVLRLRGHTRLFTDIRPEP